MTIIFRKYKILSTPNIIIYSIQLSIIFVHFYKDFLNIPDLTLKLNGFFFANFYIVISRNAGNIQEYGKDILFG